jgi:CheY-like chemotaxis protein
MESNRVVITLLLEAIGLKVTSAKDGQEAVDKGLAEPFDLILMDLMLPKINGYEATRILRENNIRIPIIALSAGVLDEDNTQSIAEHFNAMLSKPVDGKKLQETMRTYLSGFESAASGGKTMENNDNEIVIEYTH